MRIYTRKPVFSGINIVPMLDILTILLIFFIVHTEFKRQNHVLKLDLPQTHTMAGENGNADDVLLELGADGSLAFAGQEVPPARLADTVSEWHRTHPAAHIQISAAEGSSMGSFIEVMDILSAAGIQAEEIPVRIDYRP